VDDREKVAAQATSLRGDHALCGHGSYGGIDGIAA
jgi:hypothetical protein